MTGLELKEKVIATRVPFTEIADKIGVTAQSLNSTFKSSDVRSNTIEKIAQALGVPMSYFYPDNTTPINTASTCSNQNDNNVRVQKAKNMHNGNGDINDTTQESSDNNAMIQQLLLQNAQLIEIIKSKM